jgi:HK97 family phage portal protein
LNIFSWLIDKLGGRAQPSDLTLELMGEYESIVGDIYIRELAFASSMNILSNMVSKCEFKTYWNGKEQKGPQYYLWNIEPNKNQNSSAFLHKLIWQLYRRNECLVIPENKQMLVADSFSHDEYALYDDKFTGVTVGDFTFKKTFYQSDVLYWKLSEKNINGVIQGLYGSYAKLITYTMNSYQKSRGKKGVFNYESIPATGSADREAFDTLINERFKTFLKEGDAIIPLGKGQKLENFENKTYSNESTRDIRAMIDDICDFTARAFGIAPALIRGDVQDTSKALDLTLTACIDPLMDMIQEEINRKQYGYAGMNAGNYIQIDTKSIKHVDLLSVATAIDKIIGSGAFCINDVRRVCGEQPIDEPWANEHFMTKNYSTVADLLAALEGGGSTE